MGGDVHVDDDRGVTVRHLGMTTHDTGGRHHHVGLSHQRGELGRPRRHRSHLHPVVVA